VFYSAGDQTICDIYIYREKISSFVTGLAGCMARV
jgi:hypothetical protein